MKKIRQIGVAGASLFFVLSMAVYNFQIVTARGDFDVSKRQDFATDDAAFGTNENIYVKIGLDQVTKLEAGKGARLKVFLVQGGKKRLRERVPIDILTPKTAVSYRDDIQPLFTQRGAWYDRNLGKSPEDDIAFFACGECHPPFHGMDLTTHAGMLAGSDGTNPILGESFIGATDYNWSERSLLRKRLMDNRMPPGWEFNFPGAGNNRNGPNIVLDASADGDDLNIAGQFSIKRDASGNYEYSSADNAVGLIGTWVEGTDAGLSEGNVVPYGGAADVSWADIAPFFSSPNGWYHGSLACTYCHNVDTNGNGEEDCPGECHLMDLSSAAGLRGGADEGSEPLLGEDVVGVPPFDWDASELRSRLRDNRMPPDVPFVLDESNRKGRTLIHPVTSAEISAIDLIGEWVGDGAPDN